MKLVNDQGEAETAPTRPDNGYDTAPAITGDDDMLDHKFDDGKTVASVGNAFSSRMEAHTIDVGTKPDSISAVSFGSENEELQQELVATQAKLRKMEVQMAEANKRSLEALQATHHQKMHHLATELPNPLVTPPKNPVIGSSGTTFSGVGSDN
jgi:2-methylaconitate cis-trans-isomerase PrpF